MDLEMDASKCQQLQKHLEKHLRSIEILYCKYGSLHNLFTCQNKVQSKPAVALLGEVD